jgi:hypothetical protein
VTAATTTVERRVSERVTAAQRRRDTEATPDTDPTGAQMAGTSGSRFRLDLPIREPMAVDR